MSGAQRTRRHHARGHRPPGDSSSKSQPTRGRAVARAADVDQVGDEGVDQQRGCGDGVGLIGAAMDDPVLGLDADDLGEGHRETLPGPGPGPVTEHGGFPRGTGRSGPARWSGRRWGRRPRPGRAPGSGRRRCARPSCPRSWPSRRDWSCWAGPRVPCTPGGPRPRGLAADPLLAGGEEPLDRLLLGPPHDVLDHGSGREVLEVHDLLVTVLVGDLEELVGLVGAVHLLDRPLGHDLHGLVRRRRRRPRRSRPRGSADRR